MCYPFKCGKIDNVKTFTVSRVKFTFICTEWLTTTQSNPLNPTLDPSFNPSHRKSWNFLGANNGCQKQHSHCALVTLC